MFKTEVKEIPNRPISNHRYTHQGQLIMRAGTKTTIHSGPAGVMWNAAPMKASGDGGEAKLVKARAC